MDENFERDINTNEESANYNSVNNSADTNKSDYSQPDSRQNGYYPSSNYGGYQTNGQYQYTPYGYSQPKPEAEKKPSKGKKKGLIIAIIIIILAFLVAVVGIFSSLIFKDMDGKVPPADDSQVEFSEVPNGSVEEENIDGVLTPGQIYKKVHESSVGILVYTRNQQQVYSEGTGIVMGLNGDKNATYIITCAHVIDVKNGRIIVQTADGTQYDGTVVGIDSKTDIGLLRIDATDLKAAEFADSQSVSVGDDVYAIGNPGGTQFFGSFTDGMISAIGRPVNSPVGYEVACIQHTAPINPGNSGGALVNAYGQVIGVNSSKIASTEYEGMGFSVPSATVKEIVDELIKNGYVSNRPVLGVQFVEATSNQTYAIIVKANKLPAGSIVIDTIMNGSDLIGKDIKSGDMIIAVNGKDLDTYNVLLEIIENGKVGDTLTLTICRVDSQYNISTFDVDVKLVDDANVSEPVNGYDDYSDFLNPFGQ